MKLVIILESGEVIIEPIKEKYITKNDLYSEYLVDIFDLEDWYVRVGGERLPRQEVYSSFDDTDTDDDWD